MFKTELGEYIYDYCDLPKLRTKPDIILEIAEAFCARMGYKFVKTETLDQELILVTIEGEENLQLYAMWRNAYDEHGYTPPLLDIV